MADDSIKNTSESSPGEDEAEVSVVPGDAVVADDQALAPTNLGATKYVHAAFFVVGLGSAFMTGKLLATAWDALAAWPVAVRAVPQLLLYGEDERPPFTMAVGAVIGVLTVIYMFRRPGLREWADDVAGELAKVVWPTRETVTNGTIVVIVASALATVYISLLDRLWGFVTTLVYGA